MSQKTARQATLKFLLGATPRSYGSTTAGPTAHCSVQSNTEMCCKTSSVC